MSDLERALFLSTIEKLKQKAKEGKSSADDGEDARHWAVVYTELEKVSAYVQSYILKESVE